MKANRDVVLTRNTLLHFGLVSEDEKDLLLLLCQDEDLNEYCRLVYAEQAGERHARRGRAILTAEEILYFGEYFDAVRRVLFISSKHGAEMAFGRHEALKFILEFGSGSWAICNDAEKNLAVQCWLAFRAGGGVVVDGPFVYAQTVKDGEAVFRFFPKSWWELRKGNFNATATDSGDNKTPRVDRTLH